MTIETQKLRDLICRALPLPYVLATSNSWRRILSRDGAAVCSPCNQADGHVDLHFPGGDESATAKLLIEAPNALPGLLDHIDAQAAEIERLKKSLRIAVLALAHATQEYGRVYEPAYKAVDAALSGD